MFPSSQSPLIIRAIRAEQLLAQLITVSFSSIVILATVLFDTAVWFIHRLFDSSLAVLFGNRCWRVRPLALLGMVVIFPPTLLLLRLHQWTREVHDTMIPVLFSVASWKQRLVFWAGAIMIGLLIALLVNLSELAGALSQNFYHDNPWLSFIITPLGLALIAWLTVHFFPGAEGSGVPQVRAALDARTSTNDRSALVSLKIAIGKIGLSVGALLAGGSVGLGGPAVQIGGSIMTTLGKAGRFPTHFMERGLILAGSAAGFAAMFSAPLSGIVFAVEEMGRALEREISSLILTAIIFAGITAHALLNVYIFFDDRSLIMPWSEHWIAIPFCGIIGGLFGGLFSTILISGRKLLAQIKLPLVTVAFFAGLVIAAIGYLSGGESFGTGYEETKDILHSGLVSDPLFPFYKMAATISTFFSGVPGGIFVPSLAAGAGLGANLAEWAPIAPISAMILLTMVAYFSGMLQSPITSFVLVMEITATHEMLIPLMVASFIATGTSKLVCPKPLYQQLSEAYLRPRKSNE